MLCFKLTGEHNTKNTLKNFCFVGVYLQQKLGPVFPNKHVKI